MRTPEAGTGRSRRHLDREGTFFYPAVFFVTLLHVLLLLSDYNVNWMHPEVVWKRIPNALKDGITLVPQDLIQSFDCWNFDGLERSRFASYAFQIINIKFRIWLFRHLPPHPSLSLTWIFSLLLSPVLLFKIMKDLSGSRNSAWAGLSLYFLSMGFLSGITMLFHPGKPLTNFFAILCLYFASRIGRHARERDYYSKKHFQSSMLLPPFLVKEKSPLPGGSSKSARNFLGGVARIRTFAQKKRRLEARISFLFVFLLGALLFSFFLDETAWFLFVGVPIIFPRALTAPKNRSLAILTYCLTVVVFLLFVTLIPPKITKRSKFGEYNFWKCLSTPTYNQNSSTLAEFRLKNIVRNGRNLITSQIFPAWLARPQESNPIRRGFTIFFPLYFILNFLRLPPAQKKPFLRTVLALFLFLIFQTMILTKHLQVLTSLYYYGSLFSLFLTLPLAILISEKKEPFFSLNQLILIIILSVSATNYYQQNKSWMLDHETSPIHGYPTYFKTEPARMRGSSLSSEMVKKAWEKRVDKEALGELQPEFPLRSLWLFRELEQIPVKKQNLLRARGSKITADSENPEDGEVENLFDDKPATYWHVSLEKVGQPTWVMVDLGEGRSKAVRSLAARPRRDDPLQFLRTAMLLGSNNAETWDLISTIVQETPPAADQSYSWTFDNKLPYRYYRLIILDGNACGPKHYFFSLAELALYE